MLCALAVTGPIYSSPALEPKISCGCQPSTSGKFPSREPGLSHFGYKPSVPGFLWDIWPLGIDNQGLLAMALLLPCSHTPGLYPLTDPAFLCLHLDLLCLGSEKLKLLYEFSCLPTPMEAGQDEWGDTGKHTRTIHAWAATRLRVRRLAAAALLSPDPRLHLHPSPSPFSRESIQH